MFCYRRIVSPYDAFMFRFLASFERNCGVDRYFKFFVGCLKGSFLKWNSFCKLKNVRTGRVASVWLATVRNLWLLRNNIVFRNNGWYVLDVVWNVKTTVQRWSFIGDINQIDLNRTRINKKLNWQK